MLEDDSFSAREPDIHMSSDASQTFYLRYWNKEITLLVG
jgi:hypothetical protein